MIDLGACLVSRWWMQSMLERLGLAMSPPGDDVYADAVVAAS